MDHALPVPTLDLTRPAAEQIHASLKAAILELRIEPGAKLAEIEVGQMFGASRTPVREAFARLREDGLIVTLPSRGSFVSLLSEQQIRGAQFLREALELAVVDRLSQTGLDPERSQDIARILKAQQAALNSDDRREFQRQDDAFHAALAAATGFDRIAPLLLREKAALDRLRVLALTNAAHMTHLAAEHQAIFDAIQAGYQGQAADRMRLHLRQVLDTLSELIERHRDYFAPNG